MLQSVKVCWVSQVSVLLHFDLMLHVNKPTPPWRYLFSYCQCVNSPTPRGLIKNKKRQILEDHEQKLTIPQDNTSRHFRVSTNFLVDSLSLCIKMRRTNKLNSSYLRHELWYLRKSWDSTASLACWKCCVIKLVYMNRSSVYPQLCYSIMTRWDGCFINYVLESEIPGYSLYTCQ